MEATIKYDAILVPGVLVVMNKIGKIIPTNRPIRENKICIPPTFVRSFCDRNLSGNIFCQFIIVNENKVSNKHNVSNSQMKINNVSFEGGRNININIETHGIDAIRNHVNRFPLRFIKWIDKSEIWPAIGSFIMFQIP